MRRMLIGSVVAMACSVGLAAQTPTGTTKPQTPSTGKEQPAQKPGQYDDDKSAVVRGCLREGEKPGTYVLADATATSGAKLKNVRVELMGSPAGVNLKEHVGHTVEATGMMAAADTKPGTGTAPGAGTGTGAATAKPGTTGTAGTGARLNVKSVKHVKEGC